MPLLSPTRRRRGDCLRPNIKLGLGYSWVYSLVPGKCGHGSLGPPPWDTHHGALTTSSTSVPSPVQPPRPKIRGVVCVLIAQSCKTLCDPMDSSPPGSSVHGILQARILEWLALSCSRVSSCPYLWSDSLDTRYLSFFNWLRI